MFIGSLPAAVLTLFWLAATGTTQSHNQLMFRTLGAALILTSVAALFRRKIQALGAGMRPSRRAGLEALQPGLTILAGAILGFLVTFTSIGSGALGAVMLLYLYPARLNASSLVGTDIAHAIPLTFLAGIGHLIIGNVDGRLLVNLLIGSIPGIVLGSFASTRAPERIVRTALAVVLAVVGIKMIGS